MSDRGQQLEEPSLDGVRGKLNRAREHYRALESETVALFETRLLGVVVRTKGDWDAKVIIDAPPDGLPNRLGILAGDLVHNLRSALDHLAWQLVLQAGEEPGRHTAFPIYRQADDFERDVRNRSPKRGPGPLHGLDPAGDVFVRIEQLQPYNETRVAVPAAPPAETHGLTYIAELDRIDKHRELATSMAIGGESIRNVVHWDADAILLEENWPDVEGQKLTYGTLADLRFDPTGPLPNVRIVGRHLIVVAIGDGIQRAISVPGFKGLIRVATAVVRQFEHLFPEEYNWRRVQG